MRTSVDFMGLHFPEAYWLTLFPGLMLPYLMLIGITIQGKNQNCQELRPMEHGNGAIFLQVRARSMVRTALLFERFAVARQPMLCADAIDFTQNIVNHITVDAHIAVLNAKGPQIDE